MLRLADMKPITENTNTLSSIETIKKAANGKTYAIVRENRKWFVKVTDKVKDLNESDFDYIGGIRNKPKYSYNSFGEASRNMNFIFEEVNRLNGGNSVNILESDEELLDEKKYILKQKKSTPAPEPKLDFGSDEKGGGDFDFEDEGGGDDSFDFGDEGDDALGDFDLGDDDDEDFDLEDDEDLDDEGDPIKDIQKTTGELGQQLRDVEDLSSDMQKWVAKSVISALDLDNMDNSDKKDIIKAVKKKSKDDDADFEDDDTDFEDTDFGFDDEMSEDYDSYMDDEDMPLSDVDMPIRDKAYLNIDPNVLTAEDLYGPNDGYDSYMGDEKDPMKKFSKLKRKNIDTRNVEKNSLKLKRKNIPGYDSYMEDDDEINAMKQADKDISTHYNKPAAPGYEDQPTEKWRGHKLPTDTEFYLDNDYDSYMDDEDTEGMCQHCSGSGCSHCAGLGYHDVELSDVDMSIQDKGYLNIDPSVASGMDDYGSYMSDIDEVKGAPEWSRSKMLKYKIKQGTKQAIAPFKKGGNLRPDRPTKDTDVNEYGSYMEDDDVFYNGEEPCVHCAGAGYDEFTGETCEWCDGEELPLSQIDMPIRSKSYLNMDMDALVGEDELEVARGGETHDLDDILYDYESVEDELGLGESFIREDHLDSMMSTEEQRQAYIRAEKMVADMGYTIEMSTRSGMNLQSPNPSQSSSLVYLDVIDNDGTKVMGIAIDEDGYTRTSEKDNLDFIDSFENSGDISENDEDMNNIRMAEPAPAEPKTKPGTKPAEPDTDKPSRPSKRPFTPPPHITPGEEPGPKARGKGRNNTPPPLPDGSPRPWQAGDGKPPWLDDTSDIEFE